MIWLAVGATFASVFFVVSIFRMPIWDRCQFGGHTIWSNCGATLCRKHAEFLGREVF